MPDRPATGQVPVAVVGMVLSAPVLEAWLGPEFRQGATAMAILLALWLPYGASGVLIAVLVAAGQARVVARYAWTVCGASIALAVALIPPLGLEGAALAAALPFSAVVPFLLRRTVAAGGAGVGVAPAGSRGGAGARTLPPGGSWTGSRTSRSDTAIANVPFDAREYGVSRPRSCSFGTCPAA